MFGRVATIVLENCAVSECHDSMTTQHEMDLSSPDKIYRAWVDVNGYDHCTLLMVKRVSPGKPADSLVMQKIQSLAVCEVSQRMPPPPKNALSAEDIETIRVWIAAGAPREDPVVDAGSPPDGSTANPDAGTDAADAGTDAGGDLGDAGVACSAASPCAYGSACTGDACDRPWECLYHYDETLEHPCTEYTVPFCGCDGVTFAASINCPEKPYDHIGACEDTFNCDPQDVRCTAPAPTCELGLVPSVVGGCYGPCVPHSSCSCQSGWECPQPKLYACYGNELRCHTLPLPQPDAGAPDAGP